MTTERVQRAGVNTIPDPVPSPGSSNVGNITPHFAAVLAALLRNALPTPFSSDLSEDQAVAGGLWGSDDPLASLITQFTTTEFPALLSTTNEVSLAHLAPALSALLDAAQRHVPWPSEVVQGPGAWWRVMRAFQAFPAASVMAAGGRSGGSHPLPLEAFPRPAGDNGRGMHWIPTLHQSPRVIDRFVRELQAMKIKWAVILNDGTDAARNDYLVQRLVQAGIMPVMRIYTPGLQPLDAKALEHLVRHYRKLGVYYYQLYNEPNLRFENGGRDPDVGRYLDLWIPAAEAVMRAGGFPGFGALSPSGDVDDVAFLRAALRELKRRGRLDVLDRAWLSVHNYLGSHPVADTGDGMGFFRYRRYAEVLLEELGRYLPMIGTESGAYPDNGLTVEEQVQRVRQAYAYLARREPYFLAYSYWVIANEAGGGRDPAFSQQALFRPDGVSPVVSALKEL